MGLGAWTEFKNITTGNAPKITIVFEKYTPFLRLSIAYKTNIITSGNLAINTSPATASELIRSNPVNIKANPRKKPLPYLTRSIVTITNTSRVSKKTGKKLAPAMRFLRISNNA